MDKTNMSRPAEAREPTNFSSPRYPSPDHRIQNPPPRKVQITENVFLDVSMNQKSSSGSQQISIVPNELFNGNSPILPPIRNHPKSLQENRRNTPPSRENQSQFTVQNQGNITPSLENPGQRTIDNEEQSMQSTEMEKHQSSIPNQMDETQSMHMRDMTESHSGNLRCLQRSLTVSSAANDSQFQTVQPENVLLNQQGRRRQSFPSSRPLQNHPEQPQRLPTLDTPQRDSDDHIQKQQYSSVANTATVSVSAFSSTPLLRQKISQQPLEQQYQQIRNEHLLHQQQQQQREQNQHRPQIFQPDHFDSPSIQSESHMAQNNMQIYSDKTRPGWRPPLRRSKHISIISPLHLQQPRMIMDENNINPNNSSSSDLNQASSSTTNQGNQPPLSSSTQRPLPVDLLAGINQANRMDCYANDREALAEFERFFNNATFSDVTLLVGEEIFYAHRLILIKASEVFERMLSQQWNNATTGPLPDASVKKPSKSSSVIGNSASIQSPSKKSVKSATAAGEPWENIEQIELVEDRVCAKVFPAFLRFLYCNHIVLHTDNTLPLLILADKYNVVCLRKVCIDYAVANIIPSLSLKDIFHIWFQYGTKCFHQELINVCIQRLSAAGDEMIGDEDWEKDWLAMDRDQLFEFLKCSDLTIKSEFELWKAVFRWIEAPSHPERHGAYAEKTLSQIVPLIRFPFMTPDELSQMEANPLVSQYPRLFNSHIMAAYKFQALPLASRVGCSSFTGLQYVLRNYSDLRWDKRIIVPEVSSMLKYTEYSVKVTLLVFSFKTRGRLPRSDAPAARTSLILFCLAGQKWIIFRIIRIKRPLGSRTRYQADLEMEKRVGLEEVLTENSPLLVNDCLQLQLTLKPID